MTQQWISATALEKRNGTALPPYIFPFLFNPALFHKRWSREYHETNESVSAPFEKEIITTISSNSDTETKLSQAQKFRKLLKKS